jgi:hypothetical protein
MQLPFAIVPLVMFTADRSKMGALVAPRWMTALAVVVSCGSGDRDRPSSTALARGHRAAVVDRVLALCGLSWHADRPIQSLRGSGYESSAGAK